MKSYWIVGTMVLWTAFSGSQAYVAASQSAPEEKPVQQAQSANPAGIANTAPQTTTAAAAVTASPVAAGNASPATSVTPAAPATAQSKGSYMLVELTRGLKANKLKLGDKVKAEVAQDVVSHGKVIIPVETELIGHVTEVQARDGSNSESRLGIVFDRILLKHFHDINFQAVIQHISPPAPRASRVDQASQMLPPSMMGAGARQPTVSPVGGLGGPAANRGQVSTNTGSSMSGATDTTGYPSSMSVKQSPNNHADGSAAGLETTPGGKPLSIGTPKGVTGLKGLSLSEIPTASTPGPVIVSNTDNVKLDSGTQILLHVLSVETPTSAKPK